MRTILRGRNVIPDTWRYADEDGWTDLSDVIVPLDRFFAEIDGWAQRAGRVGVRLGPSDDALKLVPHIDRVALIAVEFTAFGEGRGYSQARLLRERGQFRGELRAIGVVKRDQIFFMARSGFDSFQLAERETPEAALAALASFTVAYQSGSETLLELERRPITTS